MATNEIQVSRTEKFVRSCMCDVWRLEVVADSSYITDVPPSSLLNTVLDMLALHIEHFEVSQAIEKVSVETTLKMLEEGKQVLAVAILCNQARIKKEI